MGFDEKTLVEDYIVNKLVEKGWKFVPAEELGRDTYEEPLLIPNLVRAVERINKGLDVGDEEINKVLNELRLTGTGVEGAKSILNFYKFGLPVKFEKDKVVRYVRLFDYDNIENNEFVVSTQVNNNGSERIRNDIILYVNGIPLVNIECKNPTNISENWFNAYRQIKEYEKIVPELYKYVQVGLAAESKAKYFPIVPWQDDVAAHEWRYVNISPLKGKLDEGVDAALEMFSPNVLLDILQNFLFFRLEHGEATKVITRYMQYRAANKMVSRVINNLRGQEEKNKGLIWHWQGSGKTLTMIFAANKLYYASELENPSIFFIVDRIELEEQLYQEFYSLDLVQPEIIGSIEELKNVLAYDDYRGKRGVFIVLIHKFRPEELKELQTQLEEVSKQKETVMDRKNIVAFIDEGHRTQYGLLAAQMKAILKSAFFFALTGTPISKKRRDTYREFSYPPAEPYLDRYFITDSIRDGFTVKIVYQPRLEKEHLKKDLLEAFLESMLEEIPEDSREIVEEKIKPRLNAINVFLENPQRIALKAKDIAEHFRENVDDRFKAMVVAASRKACIIYKKALDKHLPPEYSEVVMTIQTREKEQKLQDYVAETVARYGHWDPEAIRKNIINQYKEEEFPKILIVTDMLLTGFDAPVLQTMYLDKPLKEHRLLQAVARTNRPYKDVKEAGLIIDYVGILKNFKRALEIYSENDIANVFIGYDSLKNDLIKIIKEVFKILENVPKSYERETLLKAVEVITSNEKKEKTFVEKYRQLRKVFELLGPNEVKLEYFDDFKWLSAIYVYYMKVVVQRPIYYGDIEKYFNKTVRYIHKSTEVESLEKSLPSIGFGLDYLKKLEEKVKDKKEQAANILFTLNKMVLVERHRSPIYETLTERVERLLKLWREKKKDYKQLYLEGLKVLKNIETLTERQEKLGFSKLEYALLLVLERNLEANDSLIEEVKNLSSLLKKCLFPGWISQVTDKKEVERAVRKFARSLKNKYNFSLDKMNEIYNKLMESVKNYGPKASRL